MGVVGAARRLGVSGSREGPALVPEEVPTGDRGPKALPSPARGQTEDHQPLAGGLRGRAGLIHEVQKGLDVVGVGHRLRIQRPIETASELQLRAGPRVPGIDGQGARRPSLARVWKSRNAALAIDVVARLANLRLLSI